MKLERYNQESSAPAMSHKNSLDLISEIVNNNGLNVKTVELGFKKGLGYETGIALQLAISEKANETGWNTPLLNAAHKATAITLSNIGYGVSLPVIKSILNGVTNTDSQELYNNIFSSNKKTDSILAKIVFGGNVLQNEIRNAILIGKVMDAEALIENNLTNLLITQQKILSRPSLAVFCVNKLNECEASPYDSSFLNSSIKLFEQNDKFKSALIDKETGISRRETNKIKTENFKNNIYAAADNLGNGIGATVGGTVAATLNTVGGIAEYSSRYLARSSIRR